MKNYLEIFDLYFIFFESILIQFNLILGEGKERKGKEEKRD